MGKNILVVTGSPRRQGNTELLARAFADGAREAGHCVTSFPVGSMKITGCMDCKHCFTHNGECALKDDMQLIYPDFIKADMIVFASPIYFYGFTAQIKAFIDRMYARASTGYQLKSAALLILCGSPSPTELEPAIAEYRGFIGNMKLEDKGVVCATGLNERGAIMNHPALAEARALGKSLA